MKYLFLDDIRMPGDVTWIDIGNGKSYHESRGASWSIVRSYNEAVAWVIENGFPDIVSFDHDLGYEEYSLIDGKVVMTNVIEEKTGLDFAKWLVEYDLDTNTMPKDFSFTVHSRNPIGTKNIQLYLDNYLQTKR